MCELSCSLRNTHRELKIEFPQTDKHLLLSVFGKTKNDILDPDEIDPSALVLGEFPTLRAILGLQVPNPKLTQCVHAVQRARKLKAQELAAAKIKLSMKHKTLSGTGYTCEPGNSF